jgi:hypothetical protein
LKLNLETRQLEGHKKGQKNNWRKAIFLKNLELSDVTLEHAHEHH